jgi:hypothetical protein
MVAGRIKWRRLAAETLQIIFSGFSRWKPAEHWNNDRGGVISNPDDFFEGALSATLAISERALR